MLRNFAAEIDLAFASSGPNASPTAKGNGRPNHQRDHNCPIKALRDPIFERARQKFVSIYGDGWFLFSQRCAI